MDERLTFIARFWTGRRWWWPAAISDLSQRPARRSSTTGPAWTAAQRKARPRGYRCNGRKGMPS
jgi:hypothetical protein